MSNYNLGIAFFMSHLVKKCRIHRINSEGADKKE